MSILNNYKNRLFRGVIVIILLIVVVFIAFICVNQPASSLANYCKPSGITSGTDHINIYVYIASNYAVWIHLEAPMQINFNDLPDEYNPLLVNVDGSSCYRVGGQPMALNTWTWINDLNSGADHTFTISLAKGMHTISITGSYVSIDRIELVSGYCVPVGEGSNCIPRKIPIKYLN